MSLFSPNIRRCSAGGLSEADCSAINDCQWLPELSQCTPTCSALSEDTCTASIGCSWDGSKCQRRSKKEKNQWRPNAPKQCSNQLSKRECEIASGSGGMGDGCAWVDGRCQERVIITVNPDKPAGARAWADKSVDSKTAVWALSGTFITIAILIGIFSIWWNWGAIWTTVRTVAGNFRQGLAAARDGVVARGRRLTRRRARPPEPTSDEEPAVDARGAEDGGVEEGGVEDGGVENGGDDRSPTTPRSRTPPPRRGSGSVSSRAAVSPPPVSPGPSPPTTPSTPLRTSSPTPLASPAGGPPPLDVPEELDMSSRVASPTPRRSTPPTVTPTLTPVELPDVGEMRRKQDAERMLQLRRDLDELKREDASIGRQRATRRAALKTATPKAALSTSPRTPSTPAKDIAAELLSQLRQKNLEEEVRREKADEQKRQEGARQYQEIKEQQKRAVSDTPRSHNMRTPTKTGGKRKRGQRMTEGQITRVVNTFLNELTRGRKKKSRSNTRTQHVGRKPVGRRCRQRRR